MKIVLVSIKKETAKFVIGLIGVVQCVAVIYAFYFTENGISQWVALINSVVAPLMLYVLIEKDIELSAAKQYLFAMIEGEIKVTRNGRTFKTVYKDGTVHAYEVPDMNTGE